MPELVLNSIDDPSNVSMVLTVGLFPENPNRRDEMRVTFDQQAEDVLAPAQTPLYRVLGVARTQLLNDGKPAAQAGRAGRVLSALKAMFDEHALPHNRSPSLDTAFALVASHEDVSISTTQKAWYAYRSVSHIWAGLDLIGGGNEPAVAVEKAMESFPDWIAMITAFGKFAVETQIPIKSDGREVTRPIIDLGEIWDIRGKFQIPSTSLPIFHLSGDAKKTLQDYRSRTRK